MLSHQYPRALEEASVTDNGIYEGKFITRVNQVGHTEQSLPKV